MILYLILGNERLRWNFRNTLLRVIRQTLAHLSVIDTNLINISDSYSRLVKSFQLYYYIIKQYSMTIRNFCFSLGSFKKTGCENETFIVTQIVSRTSSNVIYLYYLTNECDVGFEGMSNIFF